LEWSYDGEFERTRGWRITTRCEVCACILLEEDVTRRGADGPGAQDGWEAPCNIRKGNRYTYEEFYAMTAELRAANPLEE
jgi:hypothetical protein